MATESAFVFDDSYLAVADLSSSQFYVIASTAKNTAAICTASSGSITVTGRALGILQNAPTSGHAAQVRLLGRSKAVASSTASISFGAFVAATTAGTLTTATTGMWVLGTARSASTGASGQLIEVDLFGPFQYMSAGATA